MRLSAGYSAAEYALLLLSFSIYFLFLCVTRNCFGSRNRCDDSYIMYFIIELFCGT